MVYVGIRGDADAAGLRAALEEFGELDTLELFPARGFAFAQFFTPQAAARAVAAAQTQAVRLFPAQTMGENHGRLGMPRGCLWASITIFYIYVHVYIDILTMY